MHIFSLFPILTCKCILFVHRQPYGAITEVDILFHPLDCNTKIQEEKIKLWLWTHPSSYSQVVDTLAEIFQLDKVLPSSNDSIPLCPIETTESKGSSAENGEDLKAEEIMECNEEHVADESVSRNESEDVPENKVTENVEVKQKKKEIKKVKNVNAEKLETRSIPFERTPKYTSGDKSIMMTLLKDTLNRFRLLGPKSYTLLSSALLPANVVAEEKEIKMDFEEPSSQWWKQYFGEAERLSSHQKQVASWKQLASCPHLPSPAVLPLTVRDPRVTLPTKKVPMDDKYSGNN